MTISPYHFGVVPSAAWLCVLALAGCGRIGFALERGAGATDAAPIVDGTARAPATLVQQMTNVTPVAPPVATISATLPAAVHAGDVVLAAFAYDSTGPQLGSATDSLGDVYANAAPPDNEDDFGEYLMYAVVATDGLATITVTLDGNDSSYIELQLLEYAGVSAAPLDFGASASGMPTMAGSASTPPVITTAANEQIVAYIVGHPGSITAGAGFVQRATVIGDVVEDETAVTPGSYPITLEDNEFGAWTAETAVLH